MLVPTFAKGTLPGVAFAVRGDVDLLQVLEKVATTATEGGQDFVWGSYEADAAVINTLGGLSHAMSGAAALLEPVRDIPQRLVVRVYWQELDKGGGRDSRH